MAAAEAVADDGVHGFLRPVAFVLVPEAEALPGCALVPVCGVSSEVRAWSGVDITCDLPEGHDGAHGATLEWPRG